MKLKERLAIDYADHEDYFEKHDQDLNISQAYLSGFDKAKEIAIKITDKNYSEHFILVLSHLSNELKILGDEEVE